MPNVSDCLNWQLLLTDLMYDCIFHARVSYALSEPEHPTHHQLALRQLMEARKADYVFIILLRLQL